MGFWSGLAIGLSMGFFGVLMCLVVLCSGKLNKEKEAYQRGYINGVNSAKKENK